MKPQILIVSDFYHPHWTGISKSIKYLTSALRKRFDFTILTVRYKKNLKKDEVLKGVKIYRTDYILPISRAKYSISLIFKFISIVRKFDIVFVNSPFTNILPISILSKIFGKKLVIFHQGDLNLSISLFNKFLETVFNITTFFSFLIADKVSTYSLDYAKNSRLLKYFLSKFDPLLIPLPKSLRPKGSFISRNKKDLVFGFAGRFVEEKGFDILFNAIPYVVKRYPKSLFVFAGEVNLGYENFFRDNFEAYNKNKKYIKLLGLLNNDELHIFYNLIDFIIVPSRSDCFNLVQAEAMLSQVPAISSNIPGLRYLINKTGYGITFKKESSKDLADKIGILISNKASVEKNYKNVLDILNYKKNIIKAKEFFLS